VIKKNPDQLLHAVLYLQEVTAVKKRKDAKLTPRCNNFREKNCIVPPLFSIPETPTKQRSKQSNSKNKKRYKKNEGKTEMIVASSDAVSGALTQGR
jgi:hypothetical protein